MIDQASVFADRFRNNRQALQAAVLGQNSGVDPYTALRALQLLKESDSMQMAQQGQQPTEGPSLLQEAMQQPQGLAGMPIGQPVPGQQMPQAPQQSGGLEAIPVPDQMFSGAGGGIVAFSEGGDIAALQAKLTKASAAYQSAYREGANNQEIIALMSEMQNLRGQLKSAQDAKSDNRPEEVGTAMYGDGPTIGLPEGVNAAPSPYEPPSPNQTRGLNPNATVDGRLNQATDPRVIPSAPQDPLRAQEAQANISDGASVVPATDPAFAPNTFLNNGADVAPADATAGPVNRGIGAIAQSKAMTDALAAQTTARAGLSAISYNPPDAVKPQTATERFEGAKDQIDNVKEYMGEDKYSAEARKIIEERTADLTNPDRNKFDKALAWFKGAGAMQKGRGLESIANAAAEVAGSYSVIKKEDRKEKNAIRDMNLNLTKAEQAREDGQKSTAMNWQDKAQDNKVAAAEAAAKREDARVRVETAVKGALFESATKDVSETRRDETQNRSIDSVAETARQRIESEGKTREQTAAGQRDYRNNTAYIAASEYLRKTEADVAVAKAKDEPLQKVIKDIARGERNAADGKLDQKGQANLAALKAKQKIMESKYTSRLQKAEDGFNVISERVRSAVNVSTGGIDQEAAARQWLKNNPNAPQAAAIRKKLGM